MKLTRFSKAPSFIFPPFSLPFGYKETRSPFVREKIWCVLKPESVIKAHCYFFSFSYSVRHALRLTYRFDDILYFEF